MNIFVLTAYSSKVNYDTGEVFPEYKAWPEGILETIEQLGHTIFCALRDDQYKINDADPAGAFSLDMKHLSESDVILALLDDKTSTGVQTEIGVGVALQKKVLLAHSPDNKLAYFNAAMVKAGVVHELALPLAEKELRLALI